MHTGTNWRGTSHPTTSFLFYFYKKIVVSVIKGNAWGKSIFCDINKCTSPIFMPIYAEIIQFSRKRDRNEVMQDEPSWRKCRKYGKRYPLQGCFLPKRVFPSFPCSRFFIWCFIGVQHYVQEKIISVAICSWLSTLS